MNRVLTLLVFWFALVMPARALVRVVTTLPDLADFVRQVGGDRVTVDFIVRSDQNPHFVEVKPSYMMKLKSADVFFIVGMDLEMWVPQIVDGSRNAKMEVVDLSKQVEKLEVPTRLDASQGDVHRYGNPHYWLDPRNARGILNRIVEALTRVAPEDGPGFHARADGYWKKLEGKIAEWETIMRPFAGKKIVTFHKSWTYFARWVGLEIADQVEPKPGIPPTPSHTAELILLVRQAGIRVIVVEPFYDLSAPERIAQRTEAKIVRLSTSVGGVQDSGDYIALMDYNIRTLAEALR